MIVIIETTACPVCEAPVGEDCRPPDEMGVHGARIQQFIVDASFLARREAHMQNHAAIRAAGINISERESLFLTDEEILGIYGEDDG